MKRKTVLTLGALTLLAAIMVSGCARPGKAAGSAASNTTSNTSDTGTEIKEEDAKKIALEHAKVAEADTTALQIRKEIDDGISVYNVEFYVNEKEYDYEIKASDGTIISTDFDIEHDFKASGETAKFAEADAKKLALDKVPGATEKDIQMKLERDDGRQVYEGKIIYNDREYDFSIDAENGSVLEWEEESVFD